MKARTRNFKKHEEPAHFWPSFTDIMTTIVLVLFFLVFIAYLQQVLTVSVWNQRLDEKKS